MSAGEFGKMRMSLTLTVLILGLAAMASSAEKLQVTGSLWTPYIDGELPDGGIATDLVRTALKDAGYEVESKIEKWPRAYEGTAIGIYDVVAAVWRTPQRELDLLFSDPYLYNDIVLLTRPGVLVDFSILDDLAGYRIGVVNEYAYDEAFDTHPGLTRLGNNQLIQNLLLLRQGKLDLVIADRWSAEHQIAAYLPDDASRFLMLPKPIATRELYIGVSKQNPKAQQIVDNFNAAIARLKADGRFARIVEKHRGVGAKLAIDPR